MVLLSIVNGFQIGKKFRHYMSNGDGLQCVKILDTVPLWT